MVVIQIASDLHIDINSPTEDMLKKGADILCLAGDICSCGKDEDYEIFYEFIKQESINYKFIIHIAGNHEYYGHDDIDTIKNKFRKLEHEFTNYKFLDDDIFEFIEDHKKYIFIGSTLWSFIPHWAQFYIKNYMNDYKNINVLTPTNHKGLKFKRHLTPIDTQRFHHESKKFIEDALNNLNPGSKNMGNTNIVLITHHKPIWDIKPGNKITQFAFETHLENIFEKNIKLAIHGHTHEKYDRIVNNTRIVSNPRGYVNECPDYDNNFCIDI